METITRQSKVRCARSLSNRHRLCIPSAEAPTTNISVFGSNVSTKAWFEQAYQETAERIELPERGDPKVNLLRLVLNWLLDEANGEWHMIMDNVDVKSVFFWEGGNNHISYRQGRLTAELSNRLVAADRDNPYLSPARILAVPNLCLD